MSARFDFDPSKVSTSIEVWDEGRYEVVGREPKTFYKEKENANPRAGLRFAVVRDDNKVQFIECNLMDEYGPGQAKQILMAAHGFQPRNSESEKAFDQYVQDNQLDLSIDATPGNSSIGKGWMKVKGTRFVVNMGINVSKDGSGAKFQKFVSAETL